MCMVNITEIERMVVPGTGGRGNEDLLFNGYRVPVLQDEKKFWNGLW